METIKKKMGESGALKITLRSYRFLIKNSSILRHLNQIFKDFKPGKYFKHQWNKTTRN